MLLIEIYVLPPARVRRTIPIPQGQTLSFGRREIADVCCDFDERITSIHFEVEHKGDAAEIRDLQSWSGTYVNERMVERAMLKNGDIIRAGATFFGVRMLELWPELIQSAQT